MLSRLFMMLACRRFVGRVVGVYCVDEEGCVGLVVSRASLVGIEGELTDGDQALFPWDAIRQIQHGPGCDRAMTRKREKLARHAESCPSCSDSPRAGSFSATEIAAMLREPEGA